MSMLTRCEADEFMRTDSFEFGGIGSLSRVRYDELEARLLDHPRRTLRGPSNKWWFAAAWYLAMCQKNADVHYGKYIRELLAHTRF